MSGTAEEERIAARITERFRKMRVEREAKWAATTDEEILRMRIDESAGDLDPITKACLGMAVPMWIDRMQYWRPAYREETAHKLAEVVAYEQSVAALCDTEARGTARKGDLGKAFNAIAQGLACLAFCPGGVVFAGSHWEAKQFVLKEPA